MASNHPHIEVWLFSKDSLIPQESALLQAHLKTCETCQNLFAALQVVEKQLHASPMLAPEAGFSRRWEARLASQRLMRQRWQTNLALACSAAILLAFLGALAWLSLPVLQSPFAYLLILVYRLTSFYYTLADLSSGLGFVVRLVLALAPPTLWITLAVVAASLIALWTVTYRKLSSMWRLNL